MTSRSNLQNASRYRAGLAVGWLALAVFCSGLISLAQSALAVKTIAGGPIVFGGPNFGYVDGNGINFAQFNNPVGLAMDGPGNLIIADRDNNVIRKLQLSINKVSTLLTNISKPVAVIVDATNSMFVASAGSGTVVKYDRFAIPLFTWAGLTTPTAMAIDNKGSLYVTELGGAIKRLDASNPVPVLIATGLRQPQGIVVLDSGLLAVCDTGNNLVKMINPISGVLIRAIGTGAAGFKDGPSAFAQFKQPSGVAKAGNGSLVVTDRGNNRVRLISADDIVTTLYGIDSTLWVSDFPGWDDGGRDTAESREPVGVVVSSDGIVYTTELFYHIIRAVTGSGLGGTGTGGGGGPSVDLVLAPTITPNAGYFPMGTLVLVVNPNTNSSFNNRVFYTTDGTEPTTNSLQVFLTNNVGTILWRETSRDLSSLKVKAFAGSTGSPTTSGQASGQNEIGIPRDMPAGIGATLIVPVVANLVPGQTLKSLQFLAEIAPIGTAKPLQFAVRSLPISTNDFIPIKATSSNAPNTLLDVSGPVTRLAVSYIGTNSGFEVKDFGTVAMLLVPIPANSIPGDKYSIRVVRVSGTSDGQQGIAQLTNTASRTITVTSGLTYLVGDSAPSGWYNAEFAGSVGTFGDEKLDNRDVNNAFYASLGIRVPYEGSDAFDAMDVFPEDAQGSVGGDLRIRFLDWQLILQRSLGIRTNNFRRGWVTGGVRQATATTPLLANSPIQQMEVAYSPVVWSRAAMLGAVNVGNVDSGGVAVVPIYLKVASGMKIGGFQFRAKVSAVNGGAEVGDGIAFQQASGVPAPSQSTSFNPNELLMGWSLGSFPAPLQAGSNLLGYLQFKVPAGVADGTVYKLSFSYASGAADFSGEYDFETLSSQIGVHTTALAVQDGISDDWKVAFFGTTTNPLAAANADPDGDGATNLQEYLMGTSPVKFRLHNLGSEWRKRTQAGGFVLRWYAAPGKGYALESSTSVIGGTWTPLTTLSGTGGITEFVDSNGVSGLRFYRLRTGP